jgi:opacity protein-like surface antigen
MKNFLGFLALLLAVPLSAQAQENPRAETGAEAETARASIIIAQGREIPRAEAFGRYSYLRLDANLNDDRDLNGFTTSFTYNFNQFIGVTGEFSGHYGDASGAGASADLNQYLFLFGPKFAFRGNSRVTPFAHVLPGVVRFNVDFGPNDFTTTQFAMAAGGGLDFNLTERLALRVAQADYLLTRLGQSTQNNLRVSTGFVLKF